MIKIGKYIIDAKQIKYCISPRLKDCITIVFKDGEQKDFDYITLDDLYEKMKEVE